MTVESFRWLATPGCGVAAFLLLYDTHRALRPRIAGEQPWRESRVLGMATLVSGHARAAAARRPELDERRDQGGAGAGSLVPLLWSSVTLRRLVTDFLRQQSRRLIPLTATEPP